MTDAVIEAYGTTLEEAFENAAKALCDTMIDLRTVRPKREIKFSAKGNDLYSLLFDWLDDGAPSDDRRPAAPTRGEQEPA